MNHVRPHFSRLCAFALACALLGFSLSAQAVEWRSNTDFHWSTTTGNVDVFPGPGSGNVWGSGTKAPTAGGPQWTGPKKELPFNPSPTFNGRATFSPLNMAKGLAKPLAGMAVPLLVGGLAKYLMDQACVRLSGGKMVLEPGAAWEECHMVTGQITEYQGWFSAGTSAGWYSSKSAAAEGAVQAANSSSAVTSCTTTASYNGRTYSTCAHYRVLTLDPASTSWTAVNESAYCVARFGGYPGCGTTYQGGYNTRQGTTTNADGSNDPITADAAESKLNTKLEQWTQCDFLYGYGSCAQFGGKSTGDLLDEIMTNGGSIPNTNLDPPVVQTPIVEPPVQTTTKDPATGKESTSTETTKNDYSCLVISNGQAISCKQYKTKSTVTATTSNPNGTGTVTTTATAEVTKQVDPTKGEDQADPCKAHPDRAGCKDLGTPPAAEAVPHTDKPVTITPVSFSSGSCPGPISFSAFNRSYAFEYTPLCTRLASIAPILMVIASLLAAWIFVGGLKS